MTTPKADTGIEPVMLNHGQTAALLGLGPAAFRKRLATLKRMGFPEPHPFLKTWYRGAVIAWLEGQFGLNAIRRESDAIAERAKEKWD